MFKPASSATSENLLVARLDIILTNKRITKAQASLRLCCSQSPKIGFLTSRIALDATAVLYKITDVLILPQGQQY